MNRTHDLREVMPGRLLAASLSPPVEVVVVNYNSRDDLDEYIGGLEMPEGVTLTYRHYTGREYWHMAHGFNLAVLASHGVYFWLLGTDVYLAPQAVRQVRLLIEAQGNDWMHAPGNSGNIVCRLDKFIEAGGYDERFEFYGQEGLELNDRLQRRGLKFGHFPNELLEILPTANADKVANFRLRGNKTQHSRKMRQIYEQCKRDQPMIANEGKEWGRWS